MKFTNSVRSKIVVIREISLSEPLEIVPGDHITKCMIQNGFLTAQDK